VNLRTAIKKTGRKVGLEIARWPYSSPEYSLHQAMMQHNPDVVLDVGGNDGIFGLMCRKFGYQGDMVSFEPGSHAFATLLENSRDDPRWTAERVALGDVPGQATLHVTNNLGSSSLLPMLPQHRAAAPSVKVVGSEQVPVATLDAYLRDRPWQRIALQMDVQGAEKRVLAGASDSLDRIPVIRLECSLVHLYDGDWLWDEVTLWMKDRDYTLAGVAPMFTDPVSHIQQQFDAIFVKA
jgi:FkbM family methyltransferase